mmetsp:Transcript_63600/g.207485  ORF Transcript_63600/g.207485 Transcript_63600/m.207485 type:complete len:541 (-) Transcript_63600:88-1710(-)
MGAGCLAAPSGQSLAMAGGDGELKCVTWNIAAINNNPFEYYLTLPGEDAKPYGDLMVAVQKLIESPGSRDVPVSEVFLPEMWARLKGAMAEQGWSGLDQVEARWLNDFSKRKIIEGFLKDKDLGSKRLASMPDRFTNTINNSDGSVVCRPAIINNYQGDVSNLKSWFDQWYHFMFVSEVSVKNRKGELESKKVCSLLQKITKAKYPAVTEDEEAISLPLQTLCLAIFDAILIHILNTAASSAETGAINWHDMKVKICAALVVDKQSNTINILAGQPTYLNADVIFLQEVAGAFIERLEKHPQLGDRFVVLVPQAADYVRDQNSIILVAKARLGEAGGVPEECILGGGLARADVADGDICAFSVPLRFGKTTKRVLLASFHGDTAGLASTPVVNAVRKHAADSDLRVVMGLDANTHTLEDPAGKTKFVGSFLKDLEDGPEPVKHSWEGKPSDWITTFNARSYLQPQLNKAVKYEERLVSKSTDRNPKDYILFSASAFEVASPARKDNTGGCFFEEGIDLPTLTFPSDHAIVASSLRLRASP